MTATKSSKHEAVNLEQVVIGLTKSWGPWQLKFFLWFLLLSVIVCWHALQLTFQAPNVEYWCVDEGAKETVDKCWLGDEDSGGVECSKWDYNVGHNDSTYKSTIISEWDLVCGRKWMASFSHSAYMMGSFFSSLFMSYVSDRIGRKPTILIGWIIGFLATLSAALSLSVIQFFISRLCIAFGMTTIYSAAFVLILEIVGPKYREVIGISVTFGWTAGYVSLPALAWWIRDFRYLLYICAATQVALLLAYPWITESPRWLLAKGKYSEATALLKTIVKMNRNDNNNVDVEEIINKVQKSQEVDKPSGKQTSDTYSLLDLFKSWPLARMTLIVYYLWFANCLIYYALSLNTNSLAGNAFVNFSLMGVIELPAYIASIYLVRWFGSKKIMLVTCIGAGVCCWASVLIQYNHYLGIGLIMLGKFCVTCSYTILYMYTVQIFPTVVRTIALGSSSMVARLGSILSPYIKDLTQQTSLEFSMAVVGMIAVAAGLLILPLKESSGNDMPDKPEDIEKGEDAKRTSKEEELGEGKAGQIN